MNPKPFPLDWPTDWQRTPASARKWGRFGSQKESGHGYKTRKALTVAEAVGRVIEALERTGVVPDDVVISTNIPTRLDGRPRTGAAAPDDPGVAVYWREPGAGKVSVMAIDVYTDVPDNLAAVAASLEALRTIERHGGAQVSSRAFSGFAALPPPPQPRTVERTWQDVIGYVNTCEELTAAYRALARISHPDMGGSDRAMSELNNAYRLGKEALGC